MAILTKTIGLTGRDYSTIALWEADLDDGTNAANDATAYQAGDDAIGELYADSDFTENATINGGSTIGLASITMTAPESERHDGTANGGVTIVMQSSGTGILADTTGVDWTIEWIEIDGNSISNTNGISGSGSTNKIYILRNNLIYNLVGGGGGTNRGISTTYDAWILNNIVYDITRASGSAGIAGINGSVGSNAGRDIIIQNNTVFGIQGTHADYTGDVTGITWDNNGTAADLVQNNISMDTSTLGAGTAVDYEHSSAVDATVDHNMSSDTSSFGTGSLDSKVASNQFVSTTGGSEDLHLKSGADAIDAGTDLGTTNGVNIDIDGRDREAEGDIWDMGADEFVSAGGSTIQGLSTTTGLISITF